MSSTLKKMLGLKWELKNIAPILSNTPAASLVSKDILTEPIYNQTSSIKMEDISIQKTKLLILGHNLISENQALMQDNSPQIIILKKMIKAMKLDIEQDVCIKNVIETTDCTFKSIMETGITPQAICLFGTNLINSPCVPNLALNKLRTLELSYKNIPLIITFSIPYILRNPDVKPLVWNDLQKIMTIL
jgi:hypothetical protein